jgi:hypothetical protein
MASAVSLGPVVQNPERPDDGPTFSPRDDGSGGALSPLFGFAALLLCWQLLLLGAFLGDLFGSGPYLTYHLASCIVLAMWIVRRASDTPLAAERAVALQMVAWSALAGACGALVAIALALRPVPDPDRATSAETGKLTHDHEDMPRAEQLHIALKNRRIRIEGARDVRPLMDVVAEGSRSEKLEALAVVFRRYDVTLCPVLKRALEDPDTSVRVLAATVTAKLNSVFSRKIGDCQAAAEIATASNLRELSEARLAYAESGLLEPAQARTEAELAIESFFKAREVDPLDGGIARALDRTIDKWRNTPSAEDGPRDHIRVGA